MPVVMQLEALECGAASLCMVLAYYNKWIPLEQVREDCGVSRDAQIHEDIMKRAKGYQHKLIEGGKDFSGGQRQRMEIARALAQDPTVIIFDEATSALDNITQKNVSDAIDSLKCTRIVIAHRLSTIQHADRIIYLEGGKIIEEGKYEQLIANDGPFAKLVERQRLDIETE